MLVEMTKERKSLPQLTYYSGKALCEFIYKMILFVNNKNRHYVESIPVSHRENGLQEQTTKCQLIS